ncbi:MAG: 23S rRNA (pseudouridine(1915)-N(3))-methyltransferase RlmH [Thermovirga sp.]
MKLVILSVGKPKNPLFKSQVEEYYRRVSGSVACEWQVIQETVGKRNIHTSVIGDGNGILRRLTERDYCVLMDQDGESMTSIRFSEWFFSKLGTVPGRMVLIVGGPFGVPPRVRERSDQIISLSDMTLTHEMCLLLLLEQIYRAITIKRGGRYHH